MEHYNKEQFVAFAKKCTADSGPQRKELYDFLVECFKLSDVDYDGSVDPIEFDQMIEAAAAAPREHGLAPPSAVTYKTVEARQAARTAMFKKMDTNGDGKISLDEWINFCLVHIDEKTKGL